MVDRKNNPNLEHFAQSKMRTARGYRERFMPHMPENIQKDIDDSYAKEVFYQINKIRNIIYKYGSA